MPWRNGPMFLKSTKFGGLIYETKFDMFWDQLLSWLMKRGKTPKNWSLTLSAINYWGLPRMTVTIFKSANLTYAEKEWTNAIKEHLTWGPLIRKRSPTCFQINCCHGLWKKCPRAIKMTFFNYFVQYLLHSNLSKMRKLPAIGVLWI